MEQLKFCDFESRNNKERNVHCNCENKRNNLNKNIHGKNTKDHSPKLRNLLLYKPYTQNTIIMMCHKYNFIF